MKPAIKSVLPLLLAVLLLGACGKAAPAPTPTAQPTPAAATQPPVTVTPAPTPEPTPPMDASGAYLLSGRGEAILNEPWFAGAQRAEGNARVFYEIFVGSFSDSDGDGTGDLRGILDRLDYLNDGDPASGQSLGVEGLWLTPIFPSYSYHKYDVNDYFDVDSTFGSVEDVEELAAQCHRRGMKLILDLPINHTGRGNSWFTSFLMAHRQGRTDDPYYNFYCWFPQGETAPAGRSFAQLSGTSDYYECNFSGDMPELDFDQESVRQAVLDAALFWLEKGVDGFRFDAAKYLYFGDNTKCAEFWTWYLGELRSAYPDMFAVAEVWDGDGITDLYYPALDCFDFSISQAGGLIAETAKGGNVNRYTAYVDEYTERVDAMRSGALLVPFIANHDTDCAAGYLNVEKGQMQMAANLCILGPGAPFLYYGEELGMRGSRGGANTDANRRLAMVWGDEDKVADPVGTTYPADKQIKATAADQLADGESLLSYYKKLIAIRQANPAIARGDYTALALTSRMGGFVSTLDGESVCVLHNTTGSPITADLSQATELRFSEVSAVIGQGEAALDGTTITLGAMTSAVLH